jgi:hypothetical protein
MRRGYVAHFPGQLESTPTGMLSNSGLRRDADPRVDIGRAAAIVRTDREQMGSSG